MLLIVDDLASAGVDGLAVDDPEPWWRAFVAGRPRAVVCGILVECMRALGRGRLCEVARVAAFGWPLLVSVFAVVLDPLTHPVDERGEGVAVPLLEGVASERQRGSSTLVGQHG